ncbi:MAG: hypothetical protein K2L82_09700 [Lachnospiraceae bacterium]|nr:hypothetical protein [Lachnospiraceae bacterium]
MAAFFPEALDKFISPAFLGKVRRKFHYEDKQADEFRLVAKEMLSLMRKEAFWERKTAAMDNPRLAEESDSVYENVIMSLGRGLDCLQESYCERGLLSRSYMIEVLASELLLQGYNAYNLYIKRHTDFHVAKYHFLGSEDGFPLEILPRLLENFTQEVSCNEAFCMIPKKSVAFVAELTRNEQIQCEGICVGCNNVYCQNRMEDSHSVRRKIVEMADMPLTYGYSRIFGKI